MSEIDWDKAPEGASHFCNGDWFKKEGGKWCYWFDGARSWTEAAYADPANFSWWGLRIERPSPAWSGEGLPPVGLRCEAAIPHTSGPDNERSFIWIEGSVIAYYEIKGKTYAWFAEDDGFYPPNVLEFRPVRTPEQVAADEREAAVAAMLELDPYLPNTTLGMMSRADFCRTLYDAGYRKP